MERLLNITKHFKIDSPIAEISKLGEGFINDTLIAVSQNGTRYILQKKNKNIFKNIPDMMDNILKVSQHIKDKLIIQGGDPLRSAMTIIETHGGELFTLDSENQYWTMTLFIENTIAYSQVDSPKIAEAGGRGIGRFQAMLWDFTTPLVDTLPGFHQMDFRFNQWDSIIANDPVGRLKNVRKEVEWVENRRAKMLEVWGKVQNGTIPQRVTHNDTKVSNILFTAQGEVLCVIDLDTVLTATILNDFGDCVRTYTNTGKEDDTQLENVTMSLELFEGLCKGYLSEVGELLSDEELKELAYAGEYITTEQVLRFLMDYIDGDNYYKTKSAEHNLERTRAQIALVESIEKQRPQINIIVEKYARK
ncbi:MAG: aminoglycoside phosphotransferase family protein [Rikenellaceae bacterium]